MRHQQERSGEALQKSPTHSIDSVSRWFVGSSRINKSGCDTIARHNARAALTTGKGCRCPLASRGVEMRHRRLDAVVEIPAVEPLNALIQVIMLLGMHRQRLEFMDRIQHMLRPRADVLVHVLGRIERESPRGRAITRCGRGGALA